MTTTQLSFKERLLWQTLTFGTNPTTLGTEHILSLRYTGNHQTPQLYPAYHQDDTEADLSGAMLKRLKPSFLVNGKLDLALPKTFQSKTRKRLILSCDELDAMWEEGNQMIPRILHFNLGKEKAYKALYQSLQVHLRDVPWTLQERVFQPASSDEALRFKKVRPNNKNTEQLIKSYGLTPGSYTVFIECNLDHASYSVHRTGKHFIEMKKQDTLNELYMAHRLAEFIGVWGGTPVTSVMGGIAPAAPSGREKLSPLLSGCCILILLPLPGKALWKQRSQFWSNLLEKLLVRQDWISAGCLSTTPCGETRRCDAR